MKTLTTDVHSPLEIRNESRKRWGIDRDVVRALLNALRHCLLCGTALSLSDPLCGRCWKLHFGLQTQNSLVFPEADDLRETIALMAWPAGDLTTAKLLLALKGGTFPEAFERMAVEFVRILGTNERWIRTIDRAKMILVPAPPRQEGLRDHGEQWARALSQALGIKIERLLTRDPGGRDQRQLSRAERSGVRLHLQPGGEIDPEKIYIFVDDVLTSGATFRAARSQLLGGRACWGWFIAYRT